MLSAWSRITVAAMLFYAALGAIAATPVEYRAFYVPTSDFANASADTVRARIDAAVAKAILYNFNAIALQVRVRGDAYYTPNRNSTVYPNSEPVGVVYANPPGFDALQCAIDKGHEQGVRIIAWIVTYPAWEKATAPTPANHVYNAHHEWVTQDTAGNYAQTLAGQAAALDPGVPAVQDYLTNVCLDVVHNYDIDGIQLDSLRLPESGMTSDWSKFGYNTLALAQFLADTGLVYTPSGDPTKVVKVYQQWQREQVDTLVKRIWEGAKREKPWVEVSAMIENFDDTPRILAQSYNMWTNREHLDYLAGGTYRDAFVETDWALESSYVTVPGSSLLSRPIIFAAGANAVDYGTTTDSIRLTVNTMRAKIPAPAGFAHMDYGGLAAGTDLLFHSLADTGYPYADVASYPTTGTLNVLEPVDITAPNPPQDPAWSIPEPAQVQVAFSRPVAAVDGDYPVEYRIYRETATDSPEFYGNLRMVFWDYPTSRDNYTWIDLEPLPTASYRIVAYDHWHNKADVRIGPVSIEPSNALIIETRSGGKNYGLYDYPDSGMLDSGTKSTAPGCTPGIGSRYSTSGSTSAYGTFSPGVTGTYDLYITIGAGSDIDARNTSWRILPVGPSGTIPMTDQDPAFTNVWYRFASNVVLDASSQVRIREQSPQAGRFNLDALCLVPVAGSTTATWESKPLLENVDPDFGIGDEVIADDGAGLAGAANSVNLLNYADRNFNSSTLGVNYGPGNYARYANGTTKAYKTVWSADLPVDGQYDVKAWLTDFAFTTTARYQFLAYTDSTYSTFQTVTVDASQASRGGGWCLDVDGRTSDDSSYWFRAGKTYVAMWDESGSAEILRADAMRWKLVDTVLPGANLSVTANDSPDPVLLGEDVTYTLTVANLGPDPATSVTMVLSLPADVSVKSFTSPRGTWSQQNNSLVCDIGAMVNGEQLVLTVVAAVLDGVELTSVAAVSGATDDGYPDNNTDSVQTTITPRVLLRQDDAFTSDVTSPTPGGSTGWTPFSSVQSGQLADYDAANTALRVTIATGTVPRINGWTTANSEWLPYSSVGSGHYVRGKFHVFRTGQTEITDFNQIPNMRLRLSTRFAQNSMLEVFNHLAGDTTGTSAGQDLRPSGNPGWPSLYRVDFDPVDVPVLNTAGEGVSRGFEAYALEIQENGVIGLAESAIGVYPAAALADTGPAVLAARVYQVTASDAGNLKVFNSATDGPFLRKFVLVAPATLGSEVILDGVTDPAYDESAQGVVFDTTAVASDRVGFVVREFTELGANSERIRIEPGHQYKVRWHVVASTSSNRNPQIRMRARSLKFCWAQKLEVGGALSAGDLNNTNAQQSLPGPGCANPDRLTPGEPGGWYTMLFHTPMSADIRPSQPFIAAQPGPGSADDSMRDIKFGFDLIDTLSGTPQSSEERGRVYLDRIELRAYDLLPD